MVKTIRRLTPVGLDAIDSRSVARPSGIRHGESETRTGKAEECKICRPFTRSINFIFTIGCLSRFDSRIVPNSMTELDIPPEIWGHILAFLRKPIPAVLSNPPRSDLRHPALCYAVRVCKVSLDSPDPT